MFRVSRSAPSKSLSSINNSLNSDPSFFSSEIDTGLSPPKQTVEAILDRAKVHGIETVEKLGFEADLAPIKRRIDLLLDDPAVRQDLDLWSVVLDYRLLKDGSTGVKDVLAAMLRRGDPVKLQADAVSQHIWYTVLPVVLSDEPLLYELCQTRLDFIQNRPFVFTDIVGQLLVSGRIRMAVVFGTQYLLPFFRGRSDLLYLFDIILRLKTKVALQQFCHLLERLPRFSIYADTVTKLLELGRKEHAFYLHKRLVQMGDYPTSFEQIESLVQELAAKGMQLAPFLRQLESCGISYSHQSRRVYAQQRALYRQDPAIPIAKILMPGPGARPVKLSDAFVARTFATRSVSFDFVLAGLQFVGLFEVGPLAVRELALAAGNITELTRRFQQLETMQVDLGSSNYVRVVRNLCVSGENELLQAVLKSDMHYEVFEDVQKQKRLLTEYYHSLQLHEVNRTLAILNNGRTDEIAENHSAQLAIQRAMIAGDWRGLLVELDRMRELKRDDVQDMQLAPLRLALQRIWANVRSQERYSRDYIHRVTYLVGFMQLAQAAGMNVHPWQWRSVLYVVGRSGNWKSFCDLMVTVLRMIRDDITLLTGYAQGTTTRLRVEESLFDDSMQSFILETSLTADAEARSPQELWLRGVKFLMTAGRLLNIDINHQSVSNALKSRLQRFFSGVEIGRQRRLVSIYLRQFNWAWSAFESEHGMNLPHRIRLQETSEPDVASMRLFQLRSRMVWERRKAVDEHIFGDLGEIDRSLFALDGIGAGKSQSKMSQVPLKYSMVMRDNELKDDKDSVVFYEDLLHPSYQKTAGVQKI